MKLQSNGWKVALMYTGVEAGHMDKYQFYNKFLKEEHPNVPVLRINQNNCMETIVSMQNAPIKADEIKKDKKSERDLNLPQWKATHLSDAADNLLYWKFYQSFDVVEEFMTNQIR